MTGTPIYNICKLSLCQVLPRMMHTVTPVDVYVVVAAHYYEIMLEYVLYDVHDE